VSSWGFLRPCSGGWSRLGEEGETVGASLRGTELLLNAAALGLVEKDEDRFTNKPLVAACLLLGTPGTLACSFQLPAAFYPRWGHLVEAVRTGTSPGNNRRDEKPES